MTKRYGIRMLLPTGDPMRAPHLLGDQWQAARWYASPAERDVALEKLRREDVYSRRGDRQSLVLEAVER
jgi:hypothetical protein